MEKRRVVGVILENEKKEILCTLRSKERVLGNKWEFPGGKIEGEENIFDTAHREIKEELGLEIYLENGYFDEYKYQYPGIDLELYFVKGKVISGEISLHVHDAYIWLKRENILSLDWLTGDIRVIEKLIKEAN